eukprot:24568-Eustigmatos_ZCMA.PRE.1
MCAARTRDPDHLDVLMPLCPYETPLCRSRMPMACTRPLDRGSGNTRICRSDRCESRGVEE